MSVTSISALERRVDDLEMRTAAALGIPAYGSRDQLIYRGFALTDESRARSKQALAEARQRRAQTDWPTLRAQFGLPPEGRRLQVTDGSRVAKLRARLDVLDRDLDRHPAVSDGHAPELS